MGDCYITRRGGGAGLNFKVKAYASKDLLAQTASENTLAVFSSVPISEWAVAPENPYELKTGNLFVAGSSNSYITVTGGTSSNSSFDITPYIELPDHSTEISIILTDITNTVSSNACHAFYDADKNFISSIYRTLYYNRYSVPENAKYIRISARTNDRYSVIATYTGDVKEGAVWVRDAELSNAAFNAARKNQLIIHPIDVQQYVSGKWVSRNDSMIYQNGKWVDVATYLLQRGNEFDDLTGGWGFEGFSGVSSTAGYEKTDDGIMIKSKENIWAMVAMANPIDLSKYTKLCAKHDVTSNYFRIRLAKTKNIGTSATGFIGVYELPVPGSGLQHFELDISDIDETCYIVVNSSGLLQEVYLV